MKNYDAIIIGGGASGCMAAIVTKNKNVAIMDSAKTLAKKIMVTGNGRCNLTNTNMNSTYFNQNIDKYLEQFDQTKTLELFEGMGLETYADEEGRVYPISNSAKSVVDVIISKLNNKVDAILEQKVIDIQKTQNGFVVTTDKDKYNAKKVVIACGGNALVDIVKNLGVEVKPFVPSLVALKCKDVKDLNGVKASNAKVTATNADGLSRSEIGEVLFKDGGLSGIVVFNLSTIFSRTNNFSGKINIDLMPNFSEEQVVEKLAKRKSLNVNLDKMFIGMFVNSLANEIFRQCKINTNIKSNNLTEKELTLLAKTIKNLSYNVIGSYDNNQVFSGGVKCADLDNKLMHKQIPGLYFTGEICDIDGVCGGYNLQWAWTSGKIVGDSL